MKKKFNKGIIRSLIGRICPSFSLSQAARQGVWLIVLVFSASVLGLSLLDQGGELGKLINESLNMFIGWAKWLLPILLLLAAIAQATDDEKRFDSANMLGLFLFFVSLSALSYFFALETGSGLVGAVLAPRLISLLGEYAGAILIVSTGIVALIFIFDTSLERLVGLDSWFLRFLALAFGLLAAPFLLVFSPAVSHVNSDDESDSDDDEGEVTHIEIKEETDERERRADDKENGGGKMLAKAIGSKTLNINDEAKNKQRTDFPDEAGENHKKIELNIPLDLLKTRSKSPKSGDTRRNQDIIKRTLLDFGIPVAMGDVTVGPTVTRYTLRPDSGIPVARIKGLADDLAMNLSSHSVRVEAPIPGKPLVGLEVPNLNKALVSLRDILDSSIFRKSRSNLMLALGKDVAGEVRLDDLGKLPHLLVAGATNSGKSVCLHSLILSLLYQNGPDELKLLLIDAKQVELTKYDNIPYLITPVVTDAKRAIRSLVWALGEMERRLGILSNVGARDIGEYNNKNRRDRLPYLVIVVDELGDLMSVAKKEAEAAIIRLGQKARAAGIHLILATQRPSVDILSGLIKANMPGRIAFSVTGSVNSKTILDTTGAEKLIGAGDMLYLNQGLAKPVRIQGAYVSNSEIEAVVKHIKHEVGEAKYTLDFENVPAKNYFNQDDDEVDDKLIEDAKELIAQTGRASASHLQSRLSIGYPRANRILDLLEREGLVGPSIQNKPREVLV